MLSARQTHRFVMKLHACRMLALRPRGAFTKHHDDPASHMRLLSAITILSLFTAAFAADAAPLPAPHAVDIPLASGILHAQLYNCLLYTSPSPRDGLLS